MAGGSGNKEGASLEKVHTAKRCNDRRSCRRRRRRHRGHTLPPSTLLSYAARAEPRRVVSQSFEQRRELESQRICSKSSSNLQRDILRIFSESLDWDLIIIHDDDNVVRTNQCIFRARSPHLYNALSPYFVYSNNDDRANNYIECRIERRDIFHRIKHFSRLLYINLDIKREERSLVRLILEASRRWCADAGASYSLLFFPKEERQCHESYSNTGVADPSTNAACPSDMADSGLETGSASPTREETTESDDNSATMDLEKLRVKYDKNDKCHSDAGCSFRKPVQLDTDSDEANFFVPTDSFEFVEPPSDEEKLSPNPEAAPVPKKSSSGLSSYYFIDASSLNDDERSTYVPTRSFRANAPPPPQQQQAGHERVAEFERELKMTEYLKPITEPRKVKRVDSITEDNDRAAAIEKEALVVEIKEADSGESTHPSPCSDDTSSNVEKARLSAVDAIAVKNKEIIISGSSSLKEESNNDTSRVSLIRRNTFELDPNDERLSVLRQQHERRQGHLLFQGSIPQYSGHRVDGDSCFEPPDACVKSKNFPQPMTTWTSDRDRKIYSMITGSSDADDDSSINCCKSLPVKLDCEISKPDETATPIVEPLKTTRMASSMTTAAWVVDMSDCMKNGFSSASSRTGMSQSLSSSECAIDKNSTKAKAAVTTTTSAQSKPHGSLGFFVNLNDVTSTKDCWPKASRASDKPPPPPTTTTTTTTVEPNKQSCEFFVDISSETEQPPATTINGNCDRKNIFSMFIDFKEPSDKTSQKQPSGDSGGGESSGVNGERNKAISATAGVFMFIESDSPIVRRRAMSSTRAPFQRHSWNVVDKTTNHNHRANGQAEANSVVRREHKRSHSVSVDRGDVKKLHAKSSTSSHSLSSEIPARAINATLPLPMTKARRESELEETSSRNTDTSTEEIFEYDTMIRDTPPNSHVETGKNDLESRETKEPNEDESSEVSGWEKTGTESGTEGHTRKSETFDISSASGGGSGPSPESDNRDFDLDEIASRIIILDQQKMDKVGTSSKLAETIMKIECELKKPEQYETTSGAKPAPIDSTNFVRLSDLDKAPARSRVPNVFTTTDTATTTGTTHRGLFRMSNSIPETSWVESKLAMNRSNGPVRTFPAMRKFMPIMSTSLPAKHKSPIEDDEGEAEGDGDGEGEGIISESDLSSMQSSMGRSGADASTEETETSSMGVTKPYNRLGEDLLRMFLEEINPDVTIDVNGRRIRAHKCILSSRCQYFAAILSGGWIESAGNVISLQGYSFNAVHFALCHIYSGESNIPETLSIVELATLADMLCLEGLKEVIGYTLKVKYCHLFHKPCQICSVGVLECMPLAAAYGLDEVYRKSLRWITRHFVRIWPCKAFATLPRELMDKCYHQHIVHMSTDNVLQTMMDCDKLLATLPNVRWAEPVFRMVSNLLETAVKFISDNFAGVLGNENFQALGRDLAWNISRLEDNFLAAADRLPPDQACKSYSKINKMLASAAAREIESKEGGAATCSSWGPLFVDFLRKIFARVEKCLVRDASRAARTTTWLKMDLEHRRRIQELACLVILPHEPIKRPSRHSNFIKEPRAPSARTSASRSLDLRRVKMAISEHTDKSSSSAASGTIITTTSAPSTTQQVKKPLLVVKPKSDPPERKMPSTNARQDHKRQINSGETRSAAAAVATAAATAAATATLRPKSWPNKLEVKSRYLEPRNKSTITKETHERVIVQQRRKIIISSSDSSRTSSPAMKRAVDKRPLAKIKLPIKKDTKALSSDSLAEGPTSRGNSAAGALALKKVATISKSCGITRPESPSLKRQKDADIGLSADSLAEPIKKKPQTVTGKKIQSSGIKMDTSMSTDSLVAALAAATTQIKSANTWNKVSPTLGNRQVGTSKKIQTYDRLKKFSPPMQTSPQQSARKLPRTLESSTAASRNRAAAISSAYQGSPNLRRNLLDAAKTPDMPVRSSNGVLSRTSMRPSTTASIVGRPLSDQSSTESPTKRSPKSNGGSAAHNRLNKIVTGTTAVAAKRGAHHDKSKTKCHTSGEEAQVAKQPSVGSRSGTFLKDEPTILVKSDLKSAQIGAS